MAKSYLESIIQFDGTQVNFDPVAIDDFVEAHGIRWQHWAAVPCPDSDTELGSLRSNHDSHNCLNNFHYLCKGTFIGVLSNNPLSKNIIPEGLVDSSKAYIILQNSFSLHVLTEFKWPNAPLHNFGLLIGRLLRIIKQVSYEQDF